MTNEAEIYSQAARMLEGFEFIPVTGAVCHGKKFLLWFNFRRYGQSSVGEVVVRTQPPLRNVRFRFTQFNKLQNRISRSQSTALEAFTDAKGTAVVEYVFADVACKASVIRCDESSAESRKAVDPIHSPLKGGVIWCLPDPDLDGGKKGVKGEEVRPSGNPIRRVIFRDINEQPLAEIAEYPSPCGEHAWLSINALPPECARGYLEYKLGDEYGKVVVSGEGETLRAIVPLSQEFANAAKAELKLLCHVPRRMELAAKERKLGMTRSKVLDKNVDPKLSAQIDEVKNHSVLTIVANDMAFLGEVVLVQVGDLRFARRLGSKGRPVWSESLPSMSYDTACKAESSVYLF